MSNNKLFNHNSQQTIRDEKVDLLRFIGLAMIILAHVGPPAAILQLRNFDVPLMVLVSGASFVLSYRNESYFSYVWKRIKRLLFPTWIFLSLYFLAMCIFGYPMTLPNSKKIIDSYLLLSGVGYVWVIRVFLLVALVAPMILRFNQTSTSARYFLSLAIIYLAYETLLFASRPYFETTAGAALENIFFYAIPYAIFFAIGLRLTQLSKKAMTITAMMAFMICCAVGIILWKTSGHITLTQSFKYPPSIYYLSYALAVSLIVWLAIDHLLALTKYLHIFKPVMFIAQNTIWIYLWHIPLLEMIPLSFYLKYPLVFALASSITFVQVYLVKQALIPRLKSPANIRNLNYLFTG